MTYIAQHNNYHIAQNSDWENFDELNIIHQYFTKPNPVNNFGFGCCKRIYVPIYSYQYNVTEATSSIEKG